jgi:hypothetical protein
LTSAPTKGDALLVGWLLHLGDEACNLREPLPRLWVLATLSARVATQKEQGARGGAASGEDVNTRMDAADARQAMVRLDDAERRLPELVFVLVVPPQGGQAGGVEVRHTARQEKTVVAYSAIDLLVDACGAGQPWVQVTRSQLVAFCEDLKVGVIILDAVLDVVPRYPEVDSRDQPPLEELEPLEEHDSYLYVPSRPVREGQYVVELELQPDPRGRPILLAYTSSELLVHGCGEHQPWVAIHADDIAGVAEESGAYGVLLNPVLADESRHAGPVHNWNSRSIGGN